MSSPSGRLQNAEIVGIADAESAAEIMQGLSSASRVRILDRLSKSACSVNELAEAVGLEQNAVSNHLRILRYLSLVSSERQGRHVIYSIHDQHVRELLEQVLDHVAHLPSPRD